MNPTTHRQHVLFLYLEHSSLEGRVVAWAFHDGSRVPPAQDTAPYDFGVDALADGWRLIQVSPVPTRTPGHERVSGPLKHEFLFERIVPFEG